MMYSTLYRRTMDGVRNEKIRNDFEKMRKSGVLAMRSYLEILGVTISFTNIRKQDVRERRFGRVRAEKKTEGKRKKAVLSFGMASTVAGGCRQCCGVGEGAQARPVCARVPTNRGGCGDAEWRRPLQACQGGGCDCRIIAARGKRRQEPRSWKAGAAHAR